MSKKAVTPYVFQTDEERGVYDNIEMRFTKSKNLKLGLVCVGNFGHMHPMSQLAKALIERGHQVNVITVGNEIKPKIDKIFESMPEVNIIYTEGLQQSTVKFNLETNERGETGEDAFLNHWEPHAVEACKKLQPDMIICDLSSRVGLVAADQMGIECVVMNSLSHSFSTHYGLLVNPSFKNNGYSCCGCICMFRPFIPAIARDSASYGMRHHLKEHPDSLVSFMETQHRVVISNSFFGLEPGEAIPPNIVLTGPLSDPPTDLLPILKEKDEKLSDWLDQALKDNQDVVYLSIGSEAKWRDWSVKALYHGLKKLGVKVVWSLKDFEIPVPEDPNFYVKPWIPQIEVLAHPAIKAGLTHCGFGGVNEFINASVPVIAWPHFADQHANCELLEKAGVAIVLVNKMRLTTDEDRTLAYVDVEFTDQKVHDLFKELIQNKKYKKAMIRLNAQQRCTGGSKLAVDTIERAYASGVEHLTDKALIEKTKKWSICASFCSICWLTLIIIALIFFTIQYFVLQNEIDEAIENIGGKK